jgi:hypothetical protein
MNAITPAAIATVASQNAKLKAQLKLQQETVRQRLEKVERVSPSRERATQARRNGYRGPLTRADLAKRVS